MTLKDRTHRYLENGTWVERNLSASAQGPLAKAAYFYVDRWVAPQYSCLNFTTAAEARLNHSAVE